jgi:hypothetical protein
VLLLLLLLLLLLPVRLDCLPEKGWVTQVTQSYKVTQVTKLQSYTNFE